MSTWMPVAEAAGVFALGAVSPGPSLATVVRNSVLGGRSRGLACAMGHGFGFFLYALAAVLALSWVMDAAPAIARIIEVGGLMLLAFLGAQMVRTPLGEDPDADGEERDATITGAVEGFLMAFLNPKILVFQVAVLTQVLDPTHGLGVDLAIATVGGIIDGAWYAFVAVVLTGSTALEWMQRHETRVVQVVGGCLLGLAVILGVAFAADLNAGM